MNNTITVRFTGICTHILSGLGGLPLHRTVLVRADQVTPIHDKNIPPHIPQLRIDENFIDGPDRTLEGLTQIGPGLWQFAGAQLELEGMASEHYSDETGDLVPRLASRGGQLEPVNSDVVVHEQAAGYFDVYGGVMTATKLPRGAVITELTATIDGTPKLKATSFGNHAESRIMLKPGAVINVEHTGKLLGDSPYDFLLHYLIFPTIPNDVEIPDEEVEEKKKRKAEAEDENNISAGCSNSQYP
ncbi:MAG TPA: hypothetical protein VMU84_04630 [Thermoanaerobaculia bacterium]|nr:hypothetical protein [Thermoanaerobaculia bacterium]